MVSYALVLKTELNCLGVTTMACVVKSSKPADFAKYSVINLGFLPDLTHIATLNAQCVHPNACEKKISGT